MGVFEIVLLMIMCILKIIIINLPALLVMIAIQAIIYWITDISIYNKLINFCLK